MSACYITESDNFGKTMVVNLAHTVAIEADAAKGTLTFLSINGVRTVADGIDNPRAVARAISQLIEAS